MFKCATIFLGQRVTETHLSLTAGREVAFVEAADMLGTSLTTYAKSITNEIISLARAATLVDWEDGAENQAYEVMYRAEQITTSVNIARAHSPGSCAS